MAYLGEVILMAFTEIWAPCERPHSLAEILDCTSGERNAFLLSVMDVM